MRQLAHYEINAIRTDLTRQEKARANRPRNEKLGPILKKARRDHVVSRIMDMMRDWRSSPFEKEGACRHGLRIGFCLQGHSWRKSDFEAAEIVAEAIRILGLERPTWDEGQVEHVSSSQNCAICWSEMPGATRGQRYCSTACATVALRSKGRKQKNYQGSALKSAWRLISKERTPKRACEFCGTMFHPARTVNRFCSFSCVTKHQLGDRLLADIVCECCARRFKPDSRRSKYCSQTCAGIMRLRKERERLASTVLQCPHCGDDFTPTADRQIYCTPACSSTVAKQSWYDRNYKPKLYEKTCVWCGTAFTAKMPWGNTCGSSCKASVGNLAKPVRRPRKMTPQIFDYLVRAAA
ncbi:hypothetical protein [Shinella sp.]|uniref:hypothetical protein n=1 Tax=Shinella sp. TaxID=1870904 RepID=UPI0029A9F233|nr:hypothetical protein [Shinella sp.]MDX3975797.1 hypothetical protein [Shinella sp.]